MTRANVNYLREHGPSPATDLPSQVKTGDKQAGVWRFNPSRGAVTGGGGSPTSGDWMAGPGGLHAIYYLKDDHDPSEIVQAWADANKDAITRATRHQVRALVAEAAFGDWPDGLGDHAYQHAQEGAEA